MNTLGDTEYHFNGQTNFYRGKVREVYSIGDSLLVMVASDRISAFDHVLPKGIPYKGQVLNQIAALFLEATKDIVPNWKLASPDPSATIGKRCEAYPIEMVIRGYLAGHSWREYKMGKRVICGVNMPNGMAENDKFPEPIITPATKAEEGHDEDISREEIIAQGIVAETEYLKLEEYTRALFQRGNEMASDRDLILVDTKYEFGKDEFGVITLIDEIHTPDSSRYFYKEDYSERQAKNEKQKQLSKEFVREWLMENGFEGLEGQEMPKMPESFVQLVSDRYIELYEKITGKPFERASISIIDQRVEENVSRWLQNNK
jgi:phosphoribosylaminoimidazole-succinocarboxamide synthase